MSHVTLYRQWKPSLNHLLYLLEVYNKNHTKGEEQHSKDILFYENERARLNKLNSAGTVSELEWQCLDGYLEKINIQKSRNLSLASELKSRIAFETGSLFSCHIAINTYFQRRYITENVYSNFLSDYQKVITALNKNNLDFSSISSFIAVKKAIEQYLTTQSKSEQHV